MAKDYSKVAGVVGAKVQDSVSQTVDDVVGAGSSFFQSVVDTASQAMESGAEIVADAADFAYEALPEKDDVVEAVSSIPDPLEAVGKVSQAAGKGLMALKSTPIAMMLDDIFVPSMGRKITEKNFSPESIDILKQMALDNNLKAGESMKIDYEDFNKYGAELSARFVSGTNEDTQSILDKLANLSPADEVKMTLGEAMISVDEKGNIKVVDQYDFNNWAYYGQGKNSKGSYKTLTADEFEKSDITFTEAVMDTLQNSPSDYQMMRNLAFLFGSRDYEGTERDTGRKVEIKLGKLGE